jgi:L-ribulose-5-phosphate 4-epimerase
MDMKRYQELKEQVWKSNMELFNKNIVVHTFGNVSGVDRNEGIIAIKPSGVKYLDLKAEDMVLVDFENRVVESKLKPSSDTRTHIVLYKSFKNIGGVAHTHSTYATAWAQTKKSIPCYGTTQADHIPTAIPCTKDLTNKQIKGDYETETGHQIVKECININTQESGMILVAGHGPFTWGRDPEEAVYNTVMLEEIAKLSWLTILLNPDVKPLNKTLINKHYQRKHGDKSYYGQ